MSLPCLDRRQRHWMRDSSPAIGSRPRENDVTHPGQVFWLSDRPPLAPSHPFGQWCCELRPRLQRRDRAGIAPASLSAPNGVTLDAGSANANPHRWQDRFCEIGRGAAIVGT